MKDATLAQGHRLIELILREKDPHGFVQNLHENWGEVQLIGRGGANKATLDESSQHVNLYAGEKVRPRFSYPKAYKPNGVVEQAAILVSHLEGLDVSHVETLASSWKSVSGADGLYVVPKPTVVANRLGIGDPWTNFGALTEQGPITALSGQRPFKNWRAGEIGNNRYRIADSARSALQEFEREQSGDVLVFPAQTGKLYAGFSVRNARWEIEHARNPSQWPLPSYVVAWILYANEGRLAAYEHLAIDCPGDEYKLGAESGRALCFGWSDGGLRFSSSFVGGPYGSFGSASGFARQ